MSAPEPSNGAGELAPVAHIDQLLALVEEANAFPGVDLYALLADVDRALARVYALARRD